MFIVKIQISSEILIDFVRRIFLYVKKNLIKCNSGWLPLENNFL